MKGRALREMIKDFIVDIVLKQRESVRLLLVKDFQNVIEVGFTQWLCLIF